MNQDNITDSSMSYSMEDPFNQVLYKQLFNSPFEFHYQLPIEDGTIREILSWCGSSLVNGKTEYIDLLFDSHAKKKLFGLGSSSDTTLFDQEDKSGHHLHSERICGHVFKKGEPIFRCRTCGFDDTCVMCVQCFRNSDHENHDYYFHISSSGGGCCDCGDEEAWKVKLNCKIHSVEKKNHIDETIPLPDDLTHAMSATINTILDFIVDTFADSPFISTDAPVVDQVLTSNLPEDEKEIDDNVKQQYKFALVLWNDETHSFNEVISQVTNAIHCSEEKARNIANAVDQHGRDIVLVSPDVKAVCEAGIQINHINLSVSIRSARETFREEVAGHLLRWILKLVDNIKTEGEAVGDKKYTSPLDTLRSIICSGLFATRKYRKDLILGADWREYAELEEEQDVKKMESDHWSLDRLSQVIPVFSTSKIFTPDVFHSRMRIDELLISDAKLWKSARAVLKDSFIRCIIMSGDHYRQLLAIRFGYCYLRLTRNHLSYDREHELSIIHFGVQLFTVPSIAAMLVADTPLIRVICACLKTIFLADEQNLKYFFRSFKHSRDEILPVYRQITFEDESFKHRRYDFIFHHLRYLLATPEKSSKGFPSEESDHLWSSLIDLVKIWQGMNPQRRYARQHIEYEVDYWLQAFTVAAHVQGLIQTFDICFSSDSQDNESRLGILCSSLVILMIRLSAWSNAQTFQEIRYARSALENRNPDSPVHPISEDGFHMVELLKGKNYRVPQFYVSSQHVSFHHALHWLCAELMSQIPSYFKKLNLSDPKTYWRSVFSFNEHSQFQDTSFSERPFSSSMDADRLLLLCEEPLRVIVLLTEISAGLWVRNGMSLRSQALHYKEITLPSCADSDIFFLQMFSNVIDCDHLLTAIVDRFELVPWFQGDFNYSFKDITSTHHVLMAEGFLEFLNIFLTERTFINAISIEDEIKREIIHHLATSPNGLAYSDLVKKIPERLQDKSHVGACTTSFDSILQELTTFKYPEGLSDKGLYELKHEYYEQVDPFFWHYNRNQHEEVEETLKKKFSKLKAKAGAFPFWDLSSEDVGDVRPATIVKVTQNWGLDGLDRFAYSTVLVQIIFYALWNITRMSMKATENENGENSLGQTLKSENVMKQSIHLMKVALMLETMVPDQNDKLKFSSLVTTLSFDYHQSDPKTLYSLLLDLLENQSFEELKEMKASIKYVIREINNRNTNAYDQYHTWKEKILAHLDVSEKDRSTGSEDATEAERKKKAAKARKAALMQQFAQQQQSFMDNMKDELEGSDWMDEEMVDAVDEAAHLSFFEYPHGNCIVCQESLKTGGPAYGMLGYLQSSMTQRLVDFHNVDQILGVLNSPSSLDQEGLRIPQIFKERNQILVHQENSTGNPTIHRPQNLDQQLYGMNVSSCGHLMHTSCFRNYTKAIRDRHHSQTTRNQPENRARGEFMCPLCKSLGNMLFPIHFEKTVETKLEPLPLESRKLPIVPNEDKVNQEMTQRRLIETQIDNLNDVKHGLSGIDPTYEWNGEIAYLNSAVMKKLVGVYNRRIGDVIIKTHMEDLSSFHAAFMSQKAPIIQMWNILADTISHTEIMTRGSGHGGGVMETVSSQTSLLLRVLTKVTRTYTALSSFDDVSHVEEINYKYCALLASLFGHKSKYENAPIQPALINDVFCQLVMYTILDIHPSPEKGYFEFLQQLGLFYVMSLIQALLSLMENLVDFGGHWTSSEPFLQKLAQLGQTGAQYTKMDPNFNVEDVTGLIKWISDLFELTHEARSRLSQLDSFFVYEFCTSVAHVFLRRCVILSYSAFTKDISTLIQTNTKEEKSEFERILDQFGLPKPSEFFALYKDEEHPITKCMREWLYQFKRAYPSSFNGDVSSRQKVSVASDKKGSKTIDYRSALVHVPLPIVYELIPFPHRLDLLLQECMESKCSICDTTPLNSAWCLLCGRMLCPQSFCCYDPETEVGDLTMHKKECGAGIGLFFLNKKCAIVLLHGDNKGCFMQPPYMDVHGEVDMGLRRGKPLFLNMKRYEEIRKLWLSHGIPSYVARRMEQVYDVGGWMTF